MAHQKCSWPISCGGQQFARAANRGFQWLVTNQNDDGGWGSGVAHQRLANGKILNKRDGSSVEETALALETLMHSPDPTHQAEAVEKGLAWLIDRVETGRYGLLANWFLLREAVVS